MTRNVMISIRGLQFLEDETDDNIETVQQGEYIFRNGSHILLYEEYLGEPGSHKAHEYLHTTYVKRTVN